MNANPTGTIPHGTTSANNPVIDNLLSNGATNDSVSLINNISHNKNTVLESIDSNILSKYDNVAYNFRIYMASESATIETMADEKIIVIAETGSTGLNITDVTINSIISPSTSTKNTLATAINIKIIEPFGTSLLDYIRNSANELRIRDYKSTPWWIDLRFKGYTSGGIESYDGGKATSLDGETRTWRIQVRDIGVEMTLGGTEYDIQCVSMDESSLMDNARLLEEKIDIYADTLGEFFTNFTTALNGFSNNETGKTDDLLENIRNYNITMPDEPLGDIDPDKTRSKYAIKMGTWKIGGEDKDGNKMSEWVKHNGEEIRKTTFDKGTPIEKVIERVIGSTKEGQSLLLFGEIGKTIKDGFRDPVKPSIAFIIDPRVELKSYNGIAGAYNIDIVYNIRDYKTYMPIVSQKQIDAATDKSKSKLRLKEMMLVSGIHKRYDYMFTGENTEILDYKINLDATWFISLPLYKGQGRFSQGSSGVDGEQKSVNEQVESRKKTKTIAETLISLQNKVKKYDEKLKNKSLSEQEISYYTNYRRLASEHLTRVETQAAGFVKMDLSNNESLNTQSWGSADLEKRINVSMKTNTSNAQDTTNNVNNTGSIYFAEDFNTANELTDRNPLVNYNSNITKVHVQETPTTEHGDGSIEGTRSADRSFFSMAMNQIYGLKGQMIKLDLEIRGDPYWLGEPNIIKRLTTAGGGFTDLTQTDSLLLMIFKYPVAINDGGALASEQSYTGTGMYELKTKENGFNGVYRVISVEHSFSGGKFTQRLTCNIDPLTQEQDLLKLIADMDSSA